jgi:4'-phosphopantetheinyl transferase
VTPIGDDEIHVWYVDLAAARAAAAEWPRLLSAAEQERARRFHFERDRLRFLAAHAALREILSAYVDAAPESLVFGAGDLGKPFVEKPATTIRFNASDSEEFAAFAFARGVEVGIDLELVHRRLDDVESLAESCFSSEERSVLAAARSEDRSVQFLRLWTRKEAYVKAIGKGLHVPLTSFSASFDDAPREVEGWTVVPLHPGGEAIAAVAAPAGRAWRIRERWKNSKR